MTFAYEIEYQGKKVRCRTFQDAQRFLRQMEGSSLAQETVPWSDEEFKQFTNRIRYPQRRLLKKLHDLVGSTGWLDDSKLRDDLGIKDNRVLAGVLSGISKVALGVGIEPGRVYVQRTSYRGGKPYRQYRITSGFLHAAAQHKWPSKHDLFEQ
jgi:hypothetical protein